MARLITVISALFLLISTAQAKVQYISSPPLNSVVKTSVQGCSSSSTVQLPFISWGGDISTIYANGNQKTTSKGGIFGKLGLSFNMIREDVFSKQVEAYLSCKSPYLRGTMGMINLAAPVTEKDPRTKMHIIYQLTWSTGGDAMVVKSGINKPRDLKGKTIAVQAYGPHVDYLAKVLKDAGLSISNVNIKWVKDLTGTENTPMSAFYESDVHAAMVIIPDALALTSNGTVGTGAEDSVKGAKILLSTKTANRIISDVYAVRADYYKANRQKVENFVSGMLKGQDELRKLVKNKKSQSAKYKETMKAAAKMLLDSPEAIGDAEGMYTDCQFVGLTGNKQFLQYQSYPRNFSRLNSEIQSSYTAMKLIDQKRNLTKVTWNYAQLGKGITARPESERFDKQSVAKVIAKKQRQQRLSEGELFAFEVHFKPNQNSFSADLYKNDFERVIDLASTYGGALITVEGHSDPMGYLRKKKEGSNNVVLSRIKQSAKNLSLTRANSVRDALVSYSKTKNVTLDPSQFAIVGHGIVKPKSGMCGKDPCPPKTQDQWLDNMRVEFRIIQIEAEASVFKPL